MVEAQKSAREGKWGQRLRFAAYAIGTAIGTTLLGVFSDKLKVLIDGGIAAIGDVVTWALEPSTLPKGVDAVAALLVLAAIVVGAANAVHRWWPHKLPPPAPAKVPSAAEAFRGGVYHDRLWRWDGLWDDGRPRQVFPLCSKDGATLAEGQNRLFHRRCPDCGDYAQLLPDAIDNVGLLAQRDVHTGDWQKRQAQFEREFRTLAANSGSIRKARKERSG